MKRALKPGSPLNIRNSRGLCRLLFVQFRAFPNGQLLIRLSAEQNLAICRIVGVWEEHQNRILLGLTRQPQNIARLLEW